jgi:DNA-binding CsgD family transcriptional regulator
VIHPPELLAGRAIDPAEIARIFAISANATQDHLGRIRRDGTIVLLG